MKDKLIRSIFWATVAFFIIAMGTIFIGIPLGRYLMKYIFLPCIAAFLVLGVILLVLVIKRKVPGRLGKFLLLTGASAAGMPASIVLHNLVYALFIHFFGEDFWGAGGDEPVFFFLAIIVCPLGFLVGAIGTIIIDLKNKSSTNRAIEGGKS